MDLARLDEDDLIAICEEAQEKWVLQRRKSAECDLRWCSFVLPRVGLPSNGVRPSPYLTAIVDVVVVEDPAYQHIIVAHPLFREPFAHGQES